MDVEVRLRTGETPAEVAQAAFTLLASGQDISLAPYFQVKVDFQETIRAWAVDDPGEADEFTAYAVDQAPDGGFESLRQRTVRVVWPISVWPDGSPCRSGKSSTRAGCGWTWPGISASSGPGTTSWSWTTAGGNG